LSFLIEVRPERFPWDLWRSILLLFRPIFFEALVTFVDGGLWPVHLAEDLLFYPPLDRAPLSLSIYNSPPSFSPLVVFFEDYIPTKEAPFPREESGAPSYEFPPRRHPRPHHTSPNSGPPRPPVFLFRDPSSRRPSLRNSCGPPLLPSLLPSYLFFRSRSFPESPSPRVIFFLVESSATHVF